MLGKLKPPKNITFVFQVSDVLLKVVKCFSSAGASHNQYSFYSEPLSPGVDPESLAEKIASAMHKLGYSNGPVAVSLLRSQAVFRYSKVPSQNKREIEKIAGLQAARQLPYPADELVSGFDIINSDSGGYSDISQVIVHKDVIERYAALFRKLKISPPRIILSSYSLCNLYAHACRRQAAYPAMVIDIDVGQAELAIILKGKLLFSRSATLVTSKPGWQDTVILEAAKTVDAFVKETGRARLLSGIALTGNINAASGLKGLLAGYFSLPVEILDCGNADRDSEVSFAGLVGLSHGGISESLDLLTVSLKKEREGTVLKKGLQQIAVLGCGMILVSGLAFTRDIDNKARRLAMLKGELNKISIDTKILEGLDKKLKFIEGRNKDKLAVLAVLYEVNQSCPANMSLAYFYYGQDRRLVLRGQAKELGVVFTFVSRLGKSPLLKDHGLKVRYATKRKAQAGEVVDFEIAGSH